MVNGYFLLLKKPSIFSIFFDTKTTEKFYENRPY
jgi:hypothetical protein